MKYLLLTDIPPCKNFTAGMVLHDLCSIIPEDAICCFAVVAPGLNATLADDLHSMPIEYAAKPKQRPFQIINGVIGEVIDYFVELYRAHVQTKVIAKKAIAFGKAQQVDAVWCVLQGQTMFQLANDVSAGLQKPLLTQVWDPPGWWLRDNKIDRFSKKRIMRSFEKAMRNSTRFASASWAMSETYQARYQCQPTTLIASLSQSFARPPATQLHDRETLIIALAGQLYASTEINCLISTLSQINWTIHGKKVKFRVIGSHINLGHHQATNIEYLGWNSQEDTLALLADSDILYCPYWFSMHFREEAKLSFPSKLVSFLSTGRPVLFHGPSESSPAKFLTQHNAAMVCASPYKSGLHHALLQLVENQALYAELAANGQQAFLDHFTYPTMKQQLAEFLSVDESFLLDKP